MAAPLYRPATKVTTVEMPYLALVNQADPDFQRRKFREVEYVLGTKPYLADPYQRGAYNRRDNVYAVGQPYGALDPVITAALAPTVGNAVPGLYKGVPTGGWD